MSCLFLPFFINTYFSFTNQSGIGINIFPSLLSTFTFFFSIIVSLNIIFSFYTVFFNCCCGGGWLDEVVTSLVLVVDQLVVGVD